jgi:uncharacterized protein (TIGR01777 family)
MKVLIGGGTGLIGSALAKSLLARGNQVGIISRTPDLVDEDYLSVSWDEALLVKELSDTDVVINLAGSSLAGNNPLQMRWTANRKQAIISSRMAAGQKLVAAISKLNRKPEVFLQASAIGYYGNQGLDPANENTGPGNDFLTEVCLDWESSTAALEGMGVRRLVTRIGLVLSPKGGLLPLLALPFRLFIGGKIGTGNQYFSWIHIQDIVESIQFLINDPRFQGVYNLTAPNPVTNLKFAQVLGRTLRRPVWFPIPGIAMKIALGEAATLALDGRPVHPSRLLQSGYQFSFPDLDQALRTLFST